MSDACVCLPHGTVDVGETDFAADVCGIRGGCQADRLCCGCVLYTVDEPRLRHTRICADLPLEKDARWSRSVCGLPNGSVNKIKKRRKH